MLLKGEALEAFSPSIDIRQGNPLSPYLFVLCMEWLSQLIFVVVDINLWKSIQVDRKRPKLSHLAFADDLILFAEASLEQVEVILACIDFFCDSSSGKVSNDKTRIFFSNNVNWRIREEISDTIGFQRTGDLGKYLGVKLHHERVSRNS